jgi:hypothetical protein
MAEYQLNYTGDQINTAIARALNSAPLYMRMSMSAAGELYCEQTMSDALSAIAAGRSVFLHSENNIDYALSSIDHDRAILGFSGIRYDGETSRIHMDYWTVSDMDGITFNSQIISTSGDG